MESATDAHWMRRALQVASDAAARNEVPVGAVLVRDNAEIAAAGNSMLADGDPTAHAELLALRAGAAALSSGRLGGCTLYVTLEPCAMCAGAIVLARVQRVVFGAWDDKAGMAGSTGDILRHHKLNHHPEVLAGVLAGESGAMLRDFFASRRAEQD